MRRVARDAAWRTGNDILSVGGGSINASIQSTLSQVNGPAYSTQSQQAGIAAASNVGLVVVWLTSVRQDHAPRYVRRLATLDFILERDTNTYECGKIRTRLRDACRENVRTKYSIVQKNTIGRVGGGVRVEGGSM